MNPRKWDFDTAKTSTFRDNHLNAQKVFLTNLKNENL